MLWAELAVPRQVGLERAWIDDRAGSLPIGAAVVDREGRIIGRGRNCIGPPLLYSSLLRSVCWWKARATLRSD